MLARINAAALALALAFTAVSASPLEARTDQCNSGSLHCCKSLRDGGARGVSEIGALVGATGSIGSLVGLDCVPLTGIGAGATSCSTQTACCTRNNYNGVLVFSCSPLNIQG